METVALIASLVSIGLAFFAIWQANHHRDQSDKLNRDTAEKLARIEAFATFTKEDAFAEIKRWGDFARAGGKASEEVEKAREEELRKLKEEMQVNTSAEISKVLQTVESKLSSSTTQTSTISEIKKEFEELKKGISKIQEKAVVETAEDEKRRRILTVLAKATPSDKAILRAMAQNQWTKLSDLVKSGYKVVMIIRAITLVDSLGLLAGQAYKPSDGELSREYRLDEDLKEALLR